MHEAQFHDESSFLTLTYSPEHLPASGSLSLRDYQLFLKRLRRALGSHRVRFFGCGEYGDSTWRPHYHLILFGWMFPDRRPWRKGSNGDQLYVSEHLNELWGLGNAEIGSVTLASAGYVARYCVKKVNGPAAKDHYQGRAPEFMTCSKGIGQQWFDRYHSDVYPDDFVVFKGRRMRVPKFYDRQLPDDMLEEVKSRRLERLRLHADNNTPERLAVREEVTKARTSTLKRNIE